MPTVKARKPARKARRKPKPPPYQDVESLLWQLAWKWSIMYRADPDEMFSLANLTYLDTAGKWDGTHDFKQVLRYQTWRAFLSHRRVQQRRRNAGLEGVPLSDLGIVDYDTFPVEQSQFTVSVFVDGLPDDAAEVVRLVFDPPDSLVQSLREQGGDKGGRQGGYFKRRFGDEYRGYKMCIRRYLTQQGGWTHKRVRDSFDTVAAALV